MSAVKVAISQDFMMAFSQVPRGAQKKVMDFVSKFRHDPRSAGINYETIKKARDPRYRSVRIDQNYRGIILKPDEGNVFLLLWVDKHDDAYDWARRHNCQVNAETGVLQVFESRPVEPDAADEPALAGREELHTSVGSTPASDIDSAPTPALFALTQEQYASIGVPGELLPLVQALRGESELEALEPRLPVECYEALYLLAAGTHWEAIAEDYVLKPEQPVDTSDLAAALERPESQRCFRVVEDELELREMLEAPLEYWRVFLHPSQRKLVERHWSGPVRVLGGAGTGKTVVAMHRARWLVNNVLDRPEQKVLVTTFTANLATDIEQNLRKICSTDELARIEIKHIDRWVSDYLRRKNYPHRIVYRERDRAYDEIRELALQLTPSELGLPDSFYEEEWQRVLLPSRVQTRAEYIKVSRRGRGVALNRRQRADIWPVFEEVRSQLHQRGLRTFEDATLDAADLLTLEGDYLPYRSVVVDEAQDMGPEALTLIRRLVPETGDDLLLVGDGHQRIYRRKAVMGQCGIRIVGRSRKLKINYRTTEETRRFATAVLDNMPVDDLDGNEDSSRDYRSLMHGEPPSVINFNGPEEESSGIAREIRHLLEQGVACRDICVAARTRRIRDQIASRLVSQGLEVHQLDQQNDNRTTPGVRLATMHRVKGLEFRYVFIASANKGVIPLPVATDSTEDPVEARQRDLNERALFHVAATRAMKRLYVTTSGPQSPFLGGSVS